jgi:hypothetical protein
MDAVGIANFVPLSVLCGALSFIYTFGSIQSQAKKFFLTNPIPVAYLHSNEKSNNQSVVVACKLFRGSVVLFR